MSTKPIIISANSGNFEFELIEPGQYLARCYRIVDEGTHLDVFANSKFPSKELRRLHLYFEVLKDENGNDIRMKDGRPFSISKRYTYSLNEKATLRKDLDAWRGVKLTKDEADAFDITKVLEKFCTLQVIHEDSKDGEKTFAVINAIMKTTKTADGVNPISSFTVADPDPEVFATFPEWLQIRLNDSNEMKDNPLPVITREERQAAREQGEAPATAAAPAGKKETTVSEDLEQAGF